MSSPAAILSAKLSERAEQVCRHYLSNGKKAGRYWLVGDTANSPGRSHYGDCWALLPAPARRAIGRMRQQASMAI
jgi:hypothetical protein